MSSELDSVFDEWTRGDQALRFGQFAINRLQHHLSLPNADIFYERDTVAAYQKLAKLLNRDPLDEGTRRVAEPIWTP